MRYAKLTAIVLSFVLALGLCPAAAFATSLDRTDESLFAQASIPASGTWGSCPWEISGDGTLTVRPGKGADTNARSSYLHESPWNDYRDSIRHVVFMQEDGKKVIAPAESASLLCFYSPDVQFYFSKIESIDLSGLDTSSVVNMTSMFANCAALKSLDVSGFDTSRVRYMTDMFFNCSSLASLDVTGFDTSRVTDMAYMFNGCSSLTSLDLSGFDTLYADNVTDMLGNCPSMTSVKVGARTSFLGNDLSPQATLPEGFWRNAGDEKLYPEWILALEKGGGVAAEYEKLVITPDIKVMRRIYNPNSGEHFYTADANECDYLERAGWIYEGVGWVASTGSDMPVYRLYSGTDHHYTTSAAERDHLVSVGWSYEGVGWYSDDARGIGLHRLFNPNVDPNAPRNNSGSHHYTTSDEERDHLVSIGWRYEDYGWYGVK